MSKIFFLFVVQHVCHQMRDDCTPTEDDDCGLCYNKGYCYRSDESMLGYGCRCREGFIGRTCKRKYKRPIGVMSVIDDCVHDNDIVYLK